MADAAYIDVAIINDPVARDSDGYHGMIMLPLVLKYNLGTRRCAAGQPPTSRVYFLVKKLVLLAGLAAALTLSACKVPHPPPVPGPIQPPSPPGTSH